METEVAVVFVAVVGARFLLPLFIPFYPLPADPLPEDIDEAHERDRWVAHNHRLWSTGTLEKIVLMGLLWVIYSQVLPAGSAGAPQIFLSVGFFVVVNAAISLAVARRTRSLESALATFGVRALINIAILWFASWLNDGGLHLGNAVFFVLLLSLITLLDDRFRPVHEARFAPARHAVGG